jgi:hypothetical protein
MLDLTELKKKLLSATISVAHRAVKELREEEIYSFGLYTSGEYSYVFVSVSTQAGLNQVASEYLKQPHYQEEWSSLEEARRQLKWSPCDSPHHTSFFDEFSSANELIEELWSTLTDLSEDGFDETVESIHEVFVEVLQAVRDAAILPEDVVFNVLMGDQSDESRLNNAAVLNSPQTLARLRSELQL